VPEERARAPAIHQALIEAARAMYAGSADYEALELQGAQAIAHAGMRLDYFSIKSAIDLSVPTSASSELVILAAARLGRARLIDNMRAFRR
jgi:pantoate--beta-alanine ligase